MLKLRQMLSIRAAIFASMLWMLLADRAARLSAFVLPPCVYLIFAAIFSGTTAGDLSIQVAVLDMRQDADSIELVEELRGDPQIDLISSTASTSFSNELELAQLVRQGGADVGLLIRGIDGRTRANTSWFDQPRLSATGVDRAPLIIYANPHREIATIALRGTIRKAYQNALPEVSILDTLRFVDRQLAPLNETQKRRIEAGLKSLARSPQQSSSPAAANRLEAQVLTARQPVLDEGGPPPSVVYYAGAVATLFVMFAALNAALSILDEHESALLQRLASGPGGIGAVIDGKFLFIVCQSVLQTGLIFSIAGLSFGVPFVDHFALWLLVSGALAIAASGLSVCFVCLCHSRQQANSIGTFGILILSALGGSMVPRYLMPGWVREVGWLTPNTWALESYGALGAGAQVEPPWLAISLLLASGALGLVLARWRARRFAARGG